jgi:hypothetical protein
VPPNCLAPRRREHPHVQLGKASRAQPRAHGLGGACGIAGGRDRVDLDQFLVDVESKLLVRGQRVTVRRCSSADEDRAGGEPPRDGGGA